MLSRIEAKLIRFSQSIFYFLVLVSHIIVLLLFLNIKVEGKENIPKKGRFILAANHQNFYDGFLLAYIMMNPLRRITFVIAKRALKSELNILLARLVGSVLLGNEIEEYQRVLKRLNNVLSHGGVVGIFPEGNVSKNVIPKKFKGGVAKLSLDSKSKVIPIYLSGTYLLRDSKYWFRRPTILIRIGKPIDLYNYSNELDNDLDKMAEFLRQKVIDLIQQEKTDSSNDISFTISTNIHETSNQVRLT